VDTATLKTRRSNSLVDLIVTDSTETLKGTLSSGDRDFLRCYYANARSIINKRDELLDLIQTTNLSVLGFTETWLCPDIEDCEIDFGKYNVFRRDRLEGVGGGVMILISNLLNAIERPDIAAQNNFKEMIWCQVMVNKDETLLIGCIYRTPNATQLENEHLLETLQSVCALPCDHLLIMGDFDVPKVDWKSNVARCCKGSIDYRLHQQINDCYLIQHVTFATRDIYGENSATLDLILTKDEGLVDFVEQLPPIGRSDHCGIKFELGVKARLEQSVKTIRDWRKTDFVAINREIEATDWDTLLKSLDAEDTNNVITSFIDRMISKYVPLRSVYRIVEGAGGRLEKDGN